MEPAKRPRLCSSAIDVPSSSSKQSTVIEQTAEIFLLNDDCFEAIFKWLVARDFPALSRTCVRIENLVKVYFARIYPRKRIEIHKSRGYWYRARAKKYGELQEIIRDVSFHGNYRQRSQYTAQWMENNPKNDLDLIHYFLNMDCNKAPKCLRFDNMVMGKEEGELMASALKTVELVELVDCNLDNLYDDILVHCDELKSLSVRLCTSTLEHLKWMSEQYTKLESLEIQLGTLSDYQELDTFFKSNPQIMRFSCRSRLSAYMSKIYNVLQVITDNNVQLEELFLAIGGECEFTTIQSQLFSIAEQQQFQRLSLEFGGADVKDIFIDNLNGLASIDKLYSLHITNIDIDNDLPNNIDVLAGLKELHLNNLANCEYFARQMAMIMPNLELLVVRNSSFFTPSVVGFIQPFIEYLPKLKKIVLAHDVWVSINHRLAELNAIRQKLDGACTVFIWLNSPTNKIKEKPKLIGKTLIKLMPITDEYEHF